MWFWRAYRVAFFYGQGQPGWRTTISRANLIAATRFALIKSPPQDLCNNSRKSIAVNWILAQLHTIRLARLSANANICDPKRNVLHRPRKRQTWHFIINNKMLYADYESSVCLIRFTPNTFPLSLRRSRHYGFSLGSDNACTFSVEPESMTSSKPLCTSTSAESGAQVWQCRSS